MTEPAVLLVGVNGYADVDSALRFARSGDVIEIEPGTYDGEVVVDKAVEVRARQGGGTVTLTAATGNTLMVLADATVHGLTVVGNGWDWAAIEVAGQRVRPRISNCDIQSPHSTGIRVRGGADPVVVDCRIGPSARGLQVEAAAGAYEGCSFFDVALESVIAMAGATPTVRDCVVNGPGQQAAVAADHGTVLTLDACEIVGGSVTATGGGRVTIANCAIHGGGPALEIAADGVLHAHKIRIAGATPEGILIRGGDGVFAECRITGTHGPAVWMTAGDARFERCEAIDSDGAGFLVVGGTGEFLECVAHNNADQGFSVYPEVELTACGSYGNGRPDGVGIHSPDPPVLPVKSTPTPPAPKPPAARRWSKVRRVGGDIRLKQAFRDASPGDTIEIEPGTYRCTDQVRIPPGVEIRPAERAGTVRLIAKNNPIVLSGSTTLRAVTIAAECQTAVIIRGTGVLLDGCHIAAPAGTAVKVAKGATPTLRDCTVGPAHKGLVAHGAGGHYERCTFTTTPQPVVVSHSAGMAFSDCVVLPTQGKRVAVTGKNPPLTLTGDCLTGIIETGQHATVRADKELVR